MTTYKKLDAWKISMELVKEIYIITRKYPKEEQFGLVGQCRRAAVSVPCNIAEGLGRQYKKDTIQFLHVSRGSLYELETLPHISLMVGVILQEEFSKIASIVDQTKQVLNGLINYFEKADLK